MEPRRKSDLFNRAYEHEEQGNLRTAFRLYLAGAKAGDRSCQLNVGYFYDEGKGVRRNREAALYWYRRAYRRGDASAALNIGVLWRNERQFLRAVTWFRKAVRLGDDGANLEVAKYHLENRCEPARAIPYLERVLKSDRVSEAEQEEAAELLKRA